MKAMASSLVRIVGVVQAGSARQETRHGQSPMVLGLTAAFVLLGLAVAYADSLAYLVQQWIEDDNYGHGFFVPLISLTLAWWKREQVYAAGTVSSWWGPAVLAVALVVFAVGELATLFVLQHLSLWLAVLALTLAVIGPRATNQLMFPFGYLLTAIPLPQLLEQNLTASLQLLSSILGVGFLQLVGVTAFRDGNVIDLGPMQLQVVEACSGLRYLIPLVALSLLCGYLFQERFWKKVLLVASAIPLAIVLNGLRIGMIGVLVELNGAGAAEGFMHAFEGWTLFVCSLGLLLGEMWLLANIGRVGCRRSFTQLLSVMPSTDRPNPGRIPRVLRPASWCSVGLVAVIVAVSFSVTSREEAVPTRRSFIDFPLQLQGWQGIPLSMDKQYVDTLKFDDYLLADFQGPVGSVNLYVAYYGSQKKGQSAHSPKTCLPGGGWEIGSFRETAVADGESGKPLFLANRVVIEKGQDKQVVLYWFKQRDRLVTNEYLVKAWLLWDSLTKHRSDGALVRLVAPLRPGEEIAAADQRLMQLAALVQPLLSEYVPD